MQVFQSDWRDAPVMIGDESVFAIGDVHGCADHLECLLKDLAEFASQTKPSRLVFLGDMISKGPESLKSLELWASEDLSTRFDQVHRLYGNHEQFLILVTEQWPNADEAMRAWSDAGGDVFLEELRRMAGRNGAELSQDLLQDTTSLAVQRVLKQLVGHVQIGNLIFVHGGIDPALGVKASLQAPYYQIGGNHWAWIKAPFLRHVGGFGDLLIIHGHTVPAQHRELSGQPDPHVLEYGRLSLDGGSTLTGTVMAAQFETGRYRLIYAQT